tara:strand:- start:13984 stop:14442 length:459 start_codon:yes stop_codon:yes gene_type:complete
MKQTAKEPNMETDRCDIFIYGGTVHSKRDLEFEAIVEKEMADYYIWQEATKMRMTYNQYVAHLEANPEESSSAGTVKEIKREGQRTLKRGANVRVQLKQVKGTKKDDGYVVECYDDNTVRVYLEDYGNSRIVTVNEFIKGRAGTTPVRKEQA